MLFSNVSKLNFYDSQNPLRRKTAFLTLSKRKPAKIFESPRKSGNFAEKSQMGEDLSQKSQGFSEIHQENWLFSQESTGKPIFSPMKTRDVAELVDFHAVFSGFSRDFTGRKSQNVRNFDAEEYFRGKSREKSKNKAFFHEKTEDSESFFEENMQIFEENRENQEIFLGKEKFLKDFNEKKAKKLEKPEEFAEIVRNRSENSILEEEIPIKTKKIEQKPKKSKEKPKNFVFAELEREKVAEKPKEKPLWPWFLLILLIFCLIIALFSIKN